MNYSTNYKLKKPERNEQFNLDDWNDNVDSIDNQMYKNQTNIASNASDILTIFTGLNTKNISDTSSVYYKLMQLIYPVGSLYWSSKDIDPANLFGGTWVQIKDKFVLACGDTYKASSTGGNPTVILTTANMPSHSHTFKPNGTIDMTAHTHTWSATKVESKVSKKTNYNIGRDGGDTATGIGTGSKLQWSNIVDLLSVSTTVTGSNSSTKTTGTFIGTSGTTGTSGSGTAFSIMPPYVVKYCFERIS